MPKGLSNTALTAWPPFPENPVPPLPATVLTSHLLSAAEARRPVALIAMTVTPARAAARATLRLRDRGDPSPMVGRRIGRPMTNTSLIDIARLLSSLAGPSSAGRQCRG